MAVREGFEPVIILRQSLSAPAIHADSSSCQGHKGTTMVWKSCQNRVKKPIFMSLRAALERPPPKYMPESQTVD